MRYLNIIALFCAFFAPNSLLGTNIGYDVPSKADPSGAFWHPVQQRLYWVDDHSKIYSCRSDGSDMRLEYHGKGDYEGITFADLYSDIVYIAVEAEEAIHEIDLAEGRLLRRFVVKEWIRGGDNLGIEGLTFVPDPSNPEGGLFYACEQRHGDVHAFELPIVSSRTSEAVKHVDYLEPPKGLDDAAGLHWDADSQILFIIHDNDNLIRGVRLDNTPVGEWIPGGRNQEGITFGDGLMFITGDSGEIWAVEHDLPAGGAAPPPPPPVVEVPPPVIEEPPAPEEEEEEPAPEPSREPVRKDIGDGLPRKLDPGGAVWHPRLNRLLIASDDGEVYSMKDDGSDTRPLYEGSRKFEAITVADPASSFVYLAAESRKEIWELDLDSGEVTRTFDLGEWLDRYRGQGMESLTFVPSESDPEGGLFYVGVQRTGEVIKFRLPVRSSRTSTAVSEVGRMDVVPGGRKDLTGLHYDADSGLLLSVFAKKDLLRVTHLDGSLVDEWEIDGGKYRGVTSHNGVVYLADDRGPVIRISGLLPSTGIEAPSYEEPPTPPTPPVEEEPPAPPALEEPPVEEEETPPPPAPPTPPVEEEEVEAPASGSIIERQFADRLPRRYETSGAVWHTGLQRLFVVTGDGDAHSFDPEASGRSRHYNGWRSLEAITVADPDSNFVYLGVEDSKEIWELDLTTEEISRVFDLNELLRGMKRDGLEGLTFVPDPDHPEGGLFYLGVESTGEIHALSLPIASSRTSVDVSYRFTLDLEDQREELSGLHYDPLLQLLFVVYKKDGRLRAYSDEGVLVREWIFEADDLQGVTTAGYALILAEEKGRLVWLENFLLDLVP